MLMQANISNSQGDLERNHRKLDCGLHNNNKLQVIGAGEINEEANGKSPSIFRINDLGTLCIC